MFLHELQDGDVPADVHTDYLSGDLPAVGERHHHLQSGIHHVGIGDYPTLVVEDDA